MNHYTPRPLPDIARLTIAGLMDDVQGYTNPTNDHQLAAWMMAKTRAENIVRVLQEVCDHISRATPEEDEAFDELEKKNLHHMFNQLVSCVRP